MATYESGQPEAIEAAADEAAVDEAKEGSNRAHTLASTKADTLAPAKPDGACSPGSGESTQAMALQVLRERLMTQAAAHAANPDMITLAPLLKTANSLLLGSEERRQRRRLSFRQFVEKVLDIYATPWRCTFAGNAFDTDFTQIKAGFDRELNTDEVEKVSLALRYALKAALAGRALSKPYVVIRCSSVTVISYKYDSTKSRRAAPDFYGAFSDAHRYIGYGTPIRKTDLQGEGTRGTRLMEGLGENLGILLYVR